MSGTSGTSAVRALALVARSVFIEVIRRQGFYVLLIFMLVFVLGVAAIRVVGIENPATGTFLLNLGLSLAYYSAHVLTLILSSRQIPDEIESRTIYPLLATPLERHVLLLGKWLAATLCGFGVFAVLLVLAWLCVPKLEPYSAAMLAQTIGLQSASFGLLAGVAITLSLFVPRGLTLVITGAWFAGGDRLLGLLQRAVAGSASAGPVRILLGYLPDFRRLNLITRYTDGIAALPPLQFIALVAYGVVLLYLVLAIGVRKFARQPL